MARGEKNKQEPTPKCH